MHLSILLISSLLIIFSNFNLATSFSDKATELSDTITVTEQTPKKAVHLPNQLAKEESATANSTQQKKQSSSPRLGGPPNGTAIPFATGSRNATHQDQHNASSTSDDSEDDSLKNGHAHTLSQVHPVAAFLIIFFSWATL